MERTIRVTGKGKISVKPDMVRLSITQTGVEKEYDGAVRKSVEMKKKLTDALEKLGFEKQELKTLHFDVNAEWESYQDKNKNWKRYMKGYRYTHHLKLEFPSDNKQMARVLTAIAHCPGQPEFRIEYTVADKEAAKNQLLAKAVEDSQMKAQVLAGAAGVSLGQIQLIDYSWGEIKFSSRPMEERAIKCCAENSIDESDYELDIEPDDIDVTDTVTVVWEIK